MSSFDTNKRPKKDGYVLLDSIFPGLKDDSAQSELIHKFFHGPAMRYTLHLIILTITAATCVLFFRAIHWEADHLNALERVSVEVRQLTDNDFFVSVAKFCSTELGYSLTGDAASPPVDGVVDEVMDEFYHMDALHHHEWYENMRGVLYYTGGIVSALLFMATCTTAVMSDIYHAHHRVYILRGLSHSIHALSHILLIVMMLTYVAVALDRNNFNGIVSRCPKLDGHIITTTDGFTWHKNMKWAFKEGREERELNTFAAVMVMIYGIAHFSLIKVAEGTLMTSYQAVTGMITHHVPQDHHDRLADKAETRVRLEAAAATAGRSMHNRGRNLKYTYNGRMKA